MAKVFYDRWGNRKRKAQYLFTPQYDLEAYIVDEATEGTTYICYSNAPKRAIRRITAADGVTTVEWSFGAWDDRASLEYVPICNAIEVEEAAE